MNKIQSTLEFQKERIEFLKKLLMPYYVQLFEFSKERGHFAVGSGFLIEFNDVPYIITAGHVAGSVKEEGFGVMVGDVFLSIRNNTIYFGYHPNGKNEFREKDCAILPIDSKDAEFIKTQYKFYLVSPTELNHSIYEDKWYLVTGASFTSSKPKYPSGDINAEILNIYTKELEIGKYSEYRIPRKDILLLRFTDSKMKDLQTEEKVIFKNKVGMSGSPIWVITNLFTDTPSLENLKLAGILTYSKPEWKCVIGNRINGVKEFIDAVNNVLESGPDGN